MKKRTVLFCISALAVVTLCGLALSPDWKGDGVSPTLYDTIVAMDAKWEKAYNNCIMDDMEELISEDLEFYHDQGGLLTSKEKLNDALRNNICGKVKRVLKEGSIEVYGIRGYGAVQMGLHGFMSAEGQGTPDHYSKFVHIWKKENGKWAITRVISLH